jgi:hypothetical protein
MDSRALLAPSSVGACSGKYLLPSFIFLAQPHRNCCCRPLSCRRLLHRYQGFDSNNDIPSKLIRPSRHLLGIDRFNYPDLSLIVDSLWSFVAPLGALLVVPKPFWVSYITFYPSIHSNPLNTVSGRAPKSSWLPPRRLEISISLHTPASRCEVPPAESRGYYVKTQSHLSSTPPRNYKASASDFLLEICGSSTQFPRILLAIRRATVWPSLPVYHRVNASTISSELG